MLIRLNLLVDRNTTFEEVSIEVGILYLLTLFTDGINKDRI